MRVSVVIPTWNRGHSVTRAIDSVLAQSHRDLELIVVDNASTDDTAAVLDRYLDARLRIVRLDRNEGASAGRNAGLALASGEFVAFLDSDDEVEADWLSCLVASFTSPRVAASTCGFRTIDEAGVESSATMPVAETEVYHRFRLVVLAGTLLVRTAVLREIGGYDTALTYSENTDLALRLSAWCDRARGEIGVVERALLIWHQSPERWYSAADRLRSCQRLIDKHSAQLRRDPAVLASYHAQCGVWSVRVGDIAAARRSFGRAWRVKPVGVGHLARLGIVSIPPIARRVWPP